MASPARKPWRPKLCRKKAEAVLSTQQRPSGPLEELSALRLVHELQVHQVELEMQNDELLETREELLAVLSEYTNLYDFAPIGLLTLDAGGLIRRANLMAGSLLGVYRGRLTGRSFPRLLDAPSRRRFLDHLAEPDSGSALSTCELALLPAEGAVTWIRVEEIVPGVNQERLIAFSDSTESHEARRLREDHQVQLEQLVAERTRELELRTAEYADLYNRAPCGYHSLDAQGTILGMNDTMLRMLGYTREEVVGRLRARDLLTEEGHATFQRAFPELLRTGRLRNVEADFRRKDGSAFPALINSDARLDAEGTFLHSLATVVDNTPGKEAERKQQAIQEELERQVIERTQQVRRLAVETTLAEERERRAIAHDLHDDLGQLLHVTTHQLDRLAAARTATERRALTAQMKATLMEASRSVRSLTSQLSPPVLETLGLVAALHWLSEELADTYGLEVGIQDDGLAKPLSPALATFVFRAARELLLNAAKHSGGKRASLSTRLQDRRLLIEAADEGCGTEAPERVLETAKGFGLRSIRERTLQLGGAFRVHRKPGSGWVVSLDIPLEPVGAGEPA